MADDFEDELLALAGEASEDGASRSTKPKKPKKSKKKTDSEPEDSEEISADEIDDLQGEVESDEHEEDEDKNPYPIEGKYRDLVDRDQLLALPEIEREQILYEREEQINKLEERRRIAAKLRQQNSQKANDARRSSRVSKETTSARGSKLSELKRKREEKSTRSKSKCQKSKADGSPSKRQHGDSNERSFSETSDDDHNYSARINTEDVNAIRLSRRFLAKNSNHPLLEQTIRGCFLRIKIGEDQHHGGVYRMCQIDGLRPSKRSYQVDEMSVSVSIDCKHGKSVRTFDITFVSSDKITDREFDRYKRQMEDDKLKMPSRHMIGKKTGELRYMENYRWTDEDINAHLERKKAAQRIPGNFIITKTELTQRLAHSQTTGDVEEVERLQDELAKLEELTTNRKAPIPTLDSLAKVNERNRQRNLMEIRKAELNSRRKVAMPTKVKEEPFPSMEFTNVKVLGGVEELIASTDLGIDLDI
ncbi:RNA polymerase-associated protein [Neolecta irregularis DAH-3]|uniref:RNA polymerase-associated protein n=1 Tax=Neolecta irregularis (strain DAH-3) TaxID=1198029 RepID=A0A1U7LPG7_NEOID|nr:RNA polymerase-associated protein [Neolecta irregularis DAH-3]|eukprot:OLL24483.1 RNA polymerase-associated protein [Neolecta irregularis DAH-3]